jgi:hypothetical protein
VARTVHRRIAIAGMPTVSISSNYKKLSRSLELTHAPSIFVTAPSSGPQCSWALRSSGQLRRSYGYQPVIVLIVAIYSYMQLVEPSGHGLDASLSHHASPKRQGGARGVRKALRLRAVVNTPKGFIDRGGPRDAIYQRYGRGGKQVRLLYVLQPRARIPERFRFYEDAERITRSVSPKLFRRNFSQAIRTARR